MNCLGRSCGGTGIGDSQNKNIMNKYSKKSQDQVERTMHKHKEGKLRSSSGDKVKSRSQAIAIGLSEAREKGYKVPSKKSSSSSSRKSSTSKKS
jgi:hypothetical protein